MTTPTSNPVPSSAPQDLLFNAEVLDAVVTGSAAAVTDRRGISRMSMQGAIDTLKAFNARGAWVTGTVYALKDVAVTGGIAYAAVLPHTAGTFATDLAAGRWVVHQGVVGADLASPASGKGDALVGSMRASTPGTVKSRLDGMVCNAAVDFGLSSTASRAANDAAIYAAINSGANTVFIPAPPTGQKYLLSARLQILAASLGITIVGESKTNTILSWEINAATTDKFAFLLDGNVTLRDFTIENTGTDISSSVALCSYTPGEANGMHDCRFPGVRIIGFGRGLGATIDLVTHTMVRSQVFSCAGDIEFDGCGIPIALGVGCNDNDFSCTFLNNKGARHIYLIEGMNNRIRGRFEPVHASVTSSFLNAELVRCIGTHIRGYMEPCYGFVADSSPGTHVEPECEGFDWVVGNQSSSAILRSTNASNAGVFLYPIVSRVVLPVSRAATNPVSYAVSDDNINTLTLVDAVVSRDLNLKKRPAGQANGESTISYRGVWLPTITGTSGTSAHTYTQQLGWYIRVGQQVTVFFRVAISAKDAGMGGNAQIGQLPFVSISDSLYASAANMAEYFVDLSVGYTQIMGELSSGVAHIALVQGGDSVSALFLPSAGVLSSSAFVGSLTYITDAV